MSFWTTFEHLVFPSYIIKECPKSFHSTDFPIHEKQKIEKFFKITIFSIQNRHKILYFSELEIAFHRGSFKIKWCQKIYFSGVLLCTISARVCKNKLQFNVQNAELDGKPFEILKCYWPETLTINNETFFSDSDKLSVLEYSKSNHKFFVWQKKVKI